jgi:hypothetical protein
MPLIEGCSKEAVNKNIAKLVDEGRSREQAVAIAAEKARENIDKCSSKRKIELMNGELT